LQRALVSFSEEDNSNPETFKEGIKVITRDFSSLLEKNNVETINPVGEKFDPNVHEAVFEAPSNNTKPGTIIDVIEIGYIMEKRLLRPAKVGVSAKKETK
jgi:molecular chaperone GrpE